MNKEILKPNLIFIPGWNIDANIFKPFLYNIEEYFYCHPITPILPTYKQNVELIINYINDNHLQNIHLLGWSMGGQIAMLAAESIKIERLIILNSAAIFSRDENAKTTFYNQCRNNFEHSVKYFHKLMGKLSIEDSILLKKNFINNPENSLSLLKELHTSDLTNTAKNIQTPTQIIHSREDKIIPFAEAKYLSTLMTGSCLTALESDFHFPFFNAYAKMTAILKGEKAAKL